MDILRTLWQLVLFFVPRFVTEDVAIIERPDGDYEIMCPVSQVRADERPDGVVAVRSFVWLCWGIPVDYEEREQMDIRPWKNGC